jgi:protein-tyrosine phosphatase
LPTTSDIVETLPWIDIHCHCLPGMDDGPNSMAGAIGLCRQLVGEGVGQVIATPHQLGRYEERNSARDVRAAVVELQRELDRLSIPLRVHAGGEVRIDPGVVTQLRGDQVLSLADGRKYLLLELPPEVLVNPQRLFVQLEAEGVRAVIAHVERYPAVIKQPDHALSWARAGAALQVNAGSLLGEEGNAVKACAWELLRRGLVSLVASDAHDPLLRRPLIAKVADVLAQEIGATPARQLLRENPQRILLGRPLAPVIAFVDGQARIDR